ncbi:MAG TPA: peptidoglycan recognition family protein [Baekduia sp.]|jgi:N-acetyl-anhydromuramyl-L-alanine amidase AmpD
MNRYTPHVAVRHISANRSSRGGVKPSLIVLHSTESDNRTGSGDLAAVASYLAQPSTQASAHVIVDADGYSARLVADAEKAWHCAGYNSQSLGIEQVGRAAQKAWTRDEIREAARWIARWSHLHGIPIRKGAVKNGKVTRSGVLRHMDLGAVGGGHHDPGSPYPLAAVLSLAKFYQSKI